MVFTREELVQSLQNEARILLHLITKIEPNVVDYRPTEKQRSTLELLQYLSYMGPIMISAIRSGQFDQDAWGAAVARAKTLDFNAVTEEIRQLSAQYSVSLDAYSDEDFRGEIQLFGQTASRGSFLVNLVLSGYAAYRTQIFLYLKSNGRTELNTANLWGGMDMA